MTDTPSPGLASEGMPEQIEDPRRAAEILRRGGLVAFPTETVYGLGVDATNSQAVDRLFLAKGRPSDNPLIVHIADCDQWNLVAAQMPPTAKKLLEHFSPGPITVVVPKLPSIVDRVTAGLSTVGVRIPDEPRAREMLRHVGLPIAAPSANKSGRPSCTTVRSVIEDFGTEIDGVLLGEPARIGIESSVIDCSRPRAKLLRAGGIAFEDLQQVLPDLLPMSATLEEGENSPGRLHPHYRPRARVKLVESMLDVHPEKTAAFLGVHAPPVVHGFGWCCLYASIEEYAQKLYESLREADRLGLAVIYCEIVREGRMAEALCDRLQRCAER